MKQLLYLILLVSVLATAGCKSSSLPDAQALVVAAPDSVPDPQAANGWEFRRTSATHGVFLPPVVPVKVKYKNVGNTDNSQRKSNNTESKDKSVVKDKPKVKAGKGAAIGEGNTVQASEKKQRWWLWLLPILLLAYLARSTLRKILPF